MDARIALGAIGASVLFFLGTIFALASAYAPVRLAVAAILFIVGFGMIFGVYTITRKPRPIVQRVELSGSMKAVPITCPNCGGSIPPDKIHIIDGVPYATCSYCRNTVEVAEEPKW
jgi:hypothetical protein